MPRVTIDERAIIRVSVGTDQGRGFIVATENGERFVITAAHCLPKYSCGACNACEAEEPEKCCEGTVTRLPPAHRASFPRERSYRNLLGLLGEPGTVSAECVFVDPVSDIAVLREPNAVVADEWGESDLAYSALVNWGLSVTAFEAIPIEKLQDASMMVRPIPVAPRDNGSGKGDGDKLARLLALNGCWFDCSGETSGGALVLANCCERIESGMSGSPILNSAGQAIGVVTLDTDNPRLLQCLPFWLGNRFC